MHRNLDLFEHVAGAYMQTHKGILSNEELYRIAAGRAGLPATRPQLPFHGAALGQGIQGQRIYRPGEGKARSGEI